MLTANCHPLFQRHHVFSSHSVSQLWVRSAVGVAASQLALFWSPVAPLRQGLVIRLESSLMREARTGLVIFLFSAFLKKFAYA